MNVDQATLRSVSPLLFRSRPAAVIALWGSFVAYCLGWVLTAPLFAVGLGALLRVRGKLEESADGLSPSPKPVHP